MVAIEPLRPAQSDSLPNPAALTLPPERLPKSVSKELPTSLASDLASFTGVLSMRAAEGRPGVAVTMEGESQHTPCGSENMCAVTKPLKPPSYFSSARYLSRRRQQGSDSLRLSILFNIERSWLNSPQRYALPGPGYKPLNTLQAFSIHLAQHPTNPSFPISHHLWYLKQQRWRHRVTEALTATLPPPPLKTPSRKTTYPKTHPSSSLRPCPSLATTTSHLFNSTYQKPGGQARVTLPYLDKKAAEAS